MSARLWHQNKREREGGGGDSWRRTKNSENGLEKTCLHFLQTDRDTGQLHEMG